MSVSLAPKGANFTRTVIARALTKSTEEASTLAEARWGMTSHAAIITRATVGGGSLVSGSDFDASALASQQGIEFFELVRAKTILGKLSGLRRVPMDVRCVGQTSGSTGYWVGSNKPKPLTKMAVNGSTLIKLKVAALVAMTDELARHGDPAAERAITQDLVNAAVQLLDESFVDPDNSGVSNEMPASITNGITPVTSSGEIATDLQTIIEAFPGDIDAAYFVMHPDTAVSIATARDGAGSFMFMDLGPRGGSLLGIPVICSKSCPQTSSGGMIALIDPTGIAYGAEPFTVSTITQSTLEMADDPTTGPVEQVSLWQTNTRAALVEQFTNWSAIRPCVSLLDNVYYGQQS